MYVDIPDRKALVSIDTSKNPNEHIYTEYPKSEKQIMTEMFE